MNVALLIVPVLLAALVLYGAKKKVRLYDSYVEGVKGAIPLAVSLFPYLVAIFALTELFEASGLSSLLARALAPAFRAIGIPGELSKLVLIKPFSGSGSLALLTDVFTRFGADSYIARCAAVVYGSSETVFYVSAVYFAGSKNKKLFLPVAISLISGLIGAAAGCALCRVI